MLSGQKLVQLFSTVAKPTFTANFAICADTCFARSFTAPSMLDLFKQIGPFLTKEIIEHEQFSAGIIFNSPNSQVTNLLFVRPGLHTANTQQLSLSLKNNEQHLALAQTAFMCTSKLLHLSLPENKIAHLHITTATPEQAEQLAHHPESAIREITVYDYRGPDARPR